jgi:hypothetical protein
VRCRLPWRVRLAKGISARRGPSWSLSSSSRTAASSASTSIGAASVSSISFVELDCSLPGALSRKCFCLKSSECRVVVSVRNIETSKSSMTVRICQSFLYCRCHTSCHDILDSLLLTGLLLASLPFFA